MIRDLLAAPARFRAWRKAGRRWRRIWMLPPPKPGSQEAEWLAHFRRIRPRPITSWSSVNVRGARTTRTRRRPA